jgi:CHAD domain-containing protein
VIQNMKNPSIQQAVGISPTRDREFRRSLKRHMKKQLRKLRRSYKGSVRRRDPDAVHDLRVATRRLATVLDVVTFSKHPKSVEKIARRLKQLRHVLSARRDIDVHVNIMRARQRSAASRRRKQLWNLAIRATSAEGEGVRKQSKRYLKSFDLRDLEHQIRKIVYKRLKNGFSWNQFRIATVRAEQKWRRAAREARSSWDAALFHNVRIKTKTLRYILELVLLLTDTQAHQDVVEWLKNVQDELGEWRDQAELCRRLTVILSDDPNLQADPIATTMIDSARNRSRLADQQARRAIDSILDPNSGKWLAAVSRLT